MDQRKSEPGEGISLGKKTLHDVPCPVCKGNISGVMVEEDSILKAQRVPVIIPAKCKKGHAVILFVDRAFTVRDVEAAGTAEQEQEKKGAADKAKSWMESF